MPPQIIAEVGATAATFPVPKQPASWVAHAPARIESAGVNYSHRSPKENRQMRRLLNRAASAAVKTKGSIFELVYRRLVPRLGHPQAIGATAHRLCRLIRKILHASNLSQLHRAARHERERFSTLPDHGGMNTARRKPLTISCVEAYGASCDDAVRDL